MLSLILAENSALKQNKWGLFAEWMRQTLETLAKILYPRAIVQVTTGCVRGT